MKLDRAGRPIADHAWRKGREPANKGKRYPPAPPSRAEILRAAGRLDDETPQGLRAGALIALLWRGGLAITEALALMASDVKIAPDDEEAWVRIHGRRGKSKYANRIVTLDEWGTEWLHGWLDVRADLPPGPVLCILRGPTAGQAWGTAGARAELKQLGEQAGVQRLLPQQLRYAYVVERVARGYTPQQIREALGTDRWAKIPGVESRE